MTEREKTPRHGKRRREDQVLAAAVQQSRERDERYQQLVELAPEGILIHDGEKIVLANSAAVRLAGAKEPGQLVGMPIDNFLHPPYLKAVEAELLGSGGAQLQVPTVRDSFRRLDGSEVEVEVTAIAFLDRGRPSAHLVVQDISPRLAAEYAAHQAEQRLQQAQKMEAVGALAGGVAHEVNNMMSVILGFSAFLLKDQAMPAHRLADVRHIMSAAERTAAVTRQLLAFSRRAFHQPQVLDLGATVQELQPIVSRLLGEDRQVAIESDVSLRALVDKGQLEQVIVNLALNARDAMPAGGVLSISIQGSDLPGGSFEGVDIPAGRYALIVVRDSGVGMDNATRARIFEPFFTTKPVGQGTGLGLAAAAGIMKQNNGYITVASEPGKGAAFTLLLPLLTGREAVERRREPPRRRVTSEQNGATILVVEDEAPVRAVASESLRQAGFRVLEAPNGASALELVNEHSKPDVVLTDLMMPGIGGAQLARRLKERWPTLPVLFMSGYSVDDLRRQSAIDDGSVLIQKPFTPEGLVSSVVAALSQPGIRAGQPS